MNQCYKEYISFINWSYKEYIGYIIRCYKEYIGYINRSLCQCERVEFVVRVKYDLPLAARSATHRRPPDPAGPTDLERAAGLARPCLPSAAPPAVGPDWGQGPKEGRDLGADSRRWGDE